ncbi:class I SAM-dependent methyltransferase [Xenorhabdus sp. DI]|uniref:class I SAM-dependent DNA methyltransferase n=1 Tax=Xenorhabdus doucetiae TaxID=351671 RepID=UPI0019955C35|nr:MULTISPECIES: class I SAM-dependent methyltransferase [unclassified Xenorhabdus]MBD2784938.1 class I SAM-dependent methyltransferase [Xenorhabdus sp. 3]MBD2789213.1 class I SAM-dependent methyltransferase [Xenorhabdus sp. DI]
MKKKITYDSIGESFEQFANTVAQRKIEVRTIFDMVGDVTGKSVLDLACGYGYFGRELRNRGASKVIGIDISEKMVKLAKEKSTQHGDDLEFYVRNVCNMESFGKFDIVVAAWLFNNAESSEDLETMFRVITNNLKPSGRLIAYTVEPDFQLSMGNFDIYGVNVLNEESWNGGFRHKAEFITTPPSSFTFYRWSREHYEHALEKAGFKDFEWRKPSLLESDIKSYPEGFWNIFQKNCLQTGLICQY